MDIYIMFAAAIIAVFLVVYMLIKKMDIKITLFAIGIILMYIAILMGKGIDIKDFTSTGAAFLDPLKATADIFKQTLSSSGFIILILGGYSAYMSKIGSNDVTVNVLTNPISKIKSIYILVPIVFLLGNLLSLVIPSASNLAIILLATLFPVLKKAGMSTLTAAAIIATTATVMPTPLGSDNVAIAQELAKYQQYAGLTVTDYVLKYHAMVSIPTLGFMAGLHYFWQKFMDKKDGKIVGKEKEKIDIKDAKEIQGSVLFKTVYALLPLLPILLLIIVYFTGLEITLSVEIASILSFIIAIICELIRNKGNKKVLSDTEGFFKGMASALPIVALLVAASVFVLGLKSIGLINTLQTAMVSTKGTGMGILLPLILVILSVLIVMLSGSGTALFFAMIPLVVPLAEAAGISAMAISVPMGLAGNLMRAVSPVAAVTVIVAASVNKTPLEIVKRTSVPMIGGVIFMFILSMILFL
ncbi:C4-dicarboxylate transporter DcuC [Clostridium gasigenes]|uniref:C4-dicarboxylate transporter DcuC n=1 Tax=Clostridium gasigenes TaxID=94869 RepID=UPI001C0C5912|nr:C4-dicarboxylate transporter DcuC [Clostridium gasigenes]MBU3137110.1 C4-dicarboxylate transporter DcuC [Clostridium gasigenes]